MKGSTSRLIPLGKTFLRLQLAFFVLLGIYLASSSSIASASIFTTSARRQPGADLRLEAHAAFKGHVRGSHWLPVQITASNTGADLEGTIDVNASPDGPFYTVPITLPHGARKTVTVYTFIPNFARRLLVQMRRASSILAEVKIPIETHFASERMIGMIGAKQQALQLPNEDIASGQRLFALELDPADLPERADGLASFDVLLIGDLAPESLTEYQRRALADWVGNGGLLVLGGGSNAQSILANLPPDLQPVEVERLTTTSNTNPLLLFPSPDTPNPGELSVAHVRPLHQAQVLVAGDIPLIVDQEFGKGNIIFLAFSLSDQQALRWPGIVSLWEMLLQLHPSVAFPPDLMPPEMSDRDLLSENVIAQELLTLPAIKLPDLRLLGGLLAFYIILVGPGAYWLLRRLDRQALGWLVVPLITLVFGASAYALGYHQRGGDVILNQINLLESSSSGSSRLRSFIGVFAPTHNTFQITIAQEPLIRPLNLQLPWNTSDQTGRFSTGKVAALPVAQWDIRGLLAETFLPTSSLSAQLQFDGSAFEANVQNNSTFMIEDIVLIHRLQPVWIGTLAPNEHRRITFSVPKQAPSIDLSLGSKLYPPPNADLVGVQVRTSAERRRVLIDGLLASSTLPNGTNPLLIGWLSGNLVDVAIPGQHITREQITLVLAHAAFTTTPGKVMLGHGWLRQEIVAGLSEDVSLCINGTNRGFRSFEQPVQQALIAPQPLRGIQIEQLIIVPTFDGPHPHPFTLELLDWNEATWIPFSLENQQPIETNAPARFFHPRLGMIQLRVSSPKGRNEGCISFDATITGRMP